ncbi:extracellular solute-binding protein [Paenibacillus sp. PL91]|uniref:extracellular solute-binding protein n=1 Tax=Paenibacillus sp. PL91 TaxID=2729538 RepID=UPI00145E68D3|nr:extracellular solute-binding protein [Paenibacillus sp. PL91]MBC9200836.1 extracellular solute-binding protein [Paenibacillus sp. PL91]
MKKLILVMVMSLFAISLAACGGNNAPTEESSNPTNGNTSTEKKEVTLKFQIHTADESSVQLKALRQIVKDYTEANPNIKIEVDALNSDQQKLKLKTQAASNDMPDITVVNPGAQMKPYVDGGKLAPLDDILDKDGLRDSYQKGILDYYTFDGKTYGLSEANDIGLMYYNKELFEKAGVEIPTTFEEIVEAAKQLKAKGIIPMAIGEKEPWTGSFLFTNIVIRLGGASFLQDVIDKKKSFDDPAFVKSVEKMQDLIQAGAFQEGATSFDYEQGENLFLTGKAAMYYMGSWVTASIEGSEIQDKVVAKPFPTVDGKGDPNEFMLGPGSGYVISAGTKHMDESKQFLLYYMTNYPKKMFDMKGAVGLAQIVDGDFASAGYSQTAIDVLDIFKSVKGGSIAFDNLIDPSTTQYHLNALQGMFIQKIKPEDIAAEHKSNFDINNP